MVKRFDIYLLNLDSVLSNEPKNSRPCVIISPNEMNSHIESVIIAPISSLDENYPTRVKFEFLGKHRTIVLDQIRTVEKARLTKKIGDIKGAAKQKALDILQEMFAE